MITCLRLILVMLYLEAYVDGIHLRRVNRIQAPLEDNPIHTTINIMIHSFLELTRRFS